jgi:LmbE family N-acetylglucosaminyl deacetylase
VLGAVYHEPIVDDLYVFYTQELIMNLSAVVRRVNPQILLTQSPQDYMEDHQNTCRLAVTAAFCRNIPNYPVDPPVPTVDSRMAIYHATPIELTDQLRNPIRPDLFVNVASVLPDVRRALACHRSQKEWLDTTQGMDSYLDAMVATAARVGGLSGCFQYAEGWRRHSARGFGPEDFDPLSEALGGLCARAEH